MIEKGQVQNLSQAWQTTADNVIREYFQQLFLSRLYQEKGSDGLLFKGGTALRIIWQSPRFSEDMDFTGVNITIKVIEALIEGALAKIEMEGISTEIVESKSTSGGYLAIFLFKTSEYKSRIQVEVSLRSDKKGLGTATLIQSDLVMPYTLIHLQENLLVAEKIQACLTRGKARDFYDLYFILRGRMAFKETFIQNTQLKAKILKVVKSGKLDFKRELKAFLPVNQYMIIKGFPEALVAEIERNLAG
ncbi:MAG: nucleotidyl transferase AbiEii/AbiGii toxin family protein [Candidatus Aureabacteria bacterium]|nr:nucleotidyl transferase AbiEii/AbiGii toxin family protein [Candidatus Auribacterota bacterium]